MNDFITLMKPELLLALIIFVLLFIKLGKGMNKSSLLILIQLLLLINFVAGFFFNHEGKLFGDMYKTDAMIIFQKNILNLGVYLISLLFTDWFLKTKNLPEFFTLLLSALLGMFFLISSGNLLMFFLSLELATIPVAAMANFDLHKRISSEGAIKFILISAFSSAILLFGISLIYGATGSINFVEIPSAISGNSLEILAFVFLFTAFAFKMSIVPFHLWTADVYQGAPMPTASFLSVISKGAVAFILITVLYKVFQPIQKNWYDLITLLSVVTLITGNLFALRQQNIKRFLAFSSIAQIGFILVGISGNSPEGLASVVYFVLIYIFSNLAAFAVAATISANTGKENISDYKGFYQRNRFLAWVMALALFSLAGIPPTAGFFGKLFLLKAGAANANYLFIIIVALNLILSLYYYLRVIRSMFMDKNDYPIEKIELKPGTKLGMYLCSAGIILVGIFSWVYDYIQSLT